MRIIKVCIYFQAGYQAVLEMTKTSNTLPNEDHFHYYSSYPAFEDAMSKQGNQCLRRFVSKHFGSAFELIKLSL
jgi:PMC2NT (NUC016) domain